MGKKNSSINGAATARQTHGENEMERQQDVKNNSDKFVRVEGSEFLTEKLTKRLATKVSIFRL